MIIMLMIIIMAIRTSAFVSRCLMLLGILCRSCFPAPSLMGTHSTQPDQHSAVVLAQEHYLVLHCKKKKTRFQASRFFGVPRRVLNINQITIWAWPTHLRSPKYKLTQYFTTVVDFGSVCVKQNKTKQNMCAWSLRRFA